MKGRGRGRGGPKLTDALPVSPVPVRAALIRAAAAGDRAARERLIRENVRFAGKHAARYHHLRVEYDDTRSAAIARLIRGIDEYPLPPSADDDTELVKHFCAWCRMAAFGGASVYHRGERRHYGRYATPRVGDDGYDELRTTPARGDSRAYEADELAALAEAVAALPAREAQVIRLRHGLDDGRERTFREVGRETGVSYQRVSTLYQRAMGRLRQGVAARIGDEREAG